MTQENLASIVGVSQPQIQRIENGVCGLTLEQIEVFAKALGVKPYELLPEEWQPEQLTQDEKAFIDLFRKTKETASEKPETTKAG